MNDFVKASVVNLPEFFVYSRYPAFTQDVFSERNYTIIINCCGSLNEKETIKQIINKKFEG